MTVLVIRQADWRTQRSCTHDDRGLVRYLCHNSTEQVRTACLSCGRTIGTAERFADHPDRHIYPQLVQNAEDHPLVPHAVWTDYDAYLNSEQWRERREYFIARALGRCQICNTPGGPGGRGLHVHHRSYARLGCEFDTDLVVLCADCHDLFHKARKLASAA